ncbi:MAG: NAD+ synthase [Planctomycetota bacterium]|jgi:NAD+ synthase (glutamine-hydrolysing)|nr:NAD+ synthase [Planctomycetota bacterium]
MRIALAQFDALISDLDGIAGKIRAAAAEAHAAGAELLVCPELATIGYPPRDLLDRSRLVQAQWDLVHQLATELPLPTVLGAIEPLGLDAYPFLANVAVVCQGGAVSAVYRKRLLPTYDVFDERRYFQPGNESLIVDIAGKRCGITVCEDIWTQEALGFGYRLDDPLADLEGQVDVLINLAASPYNADKPAQRRRLVRQVAERVGAPVVYVNQVGAHDELLFDGDSMAIGPDGSWYADAPRWDEGLVIADLTTPIAKPTDIDELEDLRLALVRGIRDYCRKTGQQRVVLGLSGGIDSAVVAALAVDALGADAVTGLLMPGPYSSDHSISDAIALAENLGVTHFTCPIADGYHAVMGTMSESFAGLAENVAEENIQARLRGLLVMAYANKHNAMALTTGNKSELAVGYCTIYGDMNGGLAPIGDVYKTRVFDLARHLNIKGERIPENTITKPPSAELRPDQKDSDSLPEYPELDRILKDYIENDTGPADLIARGEDPATVQRVLRLTEVNEYKRRQAAPVLRVTLKAFGVGRRMPLARKLEV